MMLPFLFAMAAAFPLQNCLPVRWPSSDPATLQLLEKSPLNCVLLEKPQWDAKFVSALHEQKRLALASMTAASAEDVDAAVKAGFDAAVWEGDLPDAELQSVRTKAKSAGLKTVFLSPRYRLEMQPGDEVAGTYQGLWPGIKAEEKGAAAAHPSGAPWIDTNSGFLRYARAAMPANSALWLSHRPPENNAWSAARYSQAIADAMMSGARWIVSLDSGFSNELMKGSPEARLGWERINDVLRFYEANQELTNLPDYSRLAVVQDAASGGLISGGVLDMIVAKHIPVRVVPTEQIAPAAFHHPKTVLNIDPASLSPEQKETLKDVARQGASLINGPPGWKIALPSKDAITFPAEEVKRQDEIWRGINSYIYGRNFAVRVFGAPGMLSDLKISPDQKRLVLHLVNYTDYPVESITFHMDAKFAKATVITPAGSKALELYEEEEGSGIDLPKVETVAILVVEDPQPAAQAKR